MPVYRVCPRLNRENYRWPKTGKMASREKVDWVAARGLKEDGAVPPSLTTPFGRGFVNIGKLGVSARIEIVIQDELRASATADD